MFGRLLCVVAVLLVNYKLNEVEARSKRSEVMPVQPLLEYIEERKLDTQERPLFSRYVYTDEKAEFPERQITKKKKKRKIIKHNKNKNVRNVKTPKDKNITHKKKAVGNNEQKLNKKWLPENDKDSNLSESKENGVKAKPVDIIVHIKMSE